LIAHRPFATNEVFHGYDRVSFPIFRLMERKKNALTHAPQVTDCVKRSCGYWLLLGDVEQLHIALFVLGFRNWIVPPEKLSSARFVGFKIAV
jgi:hypothetical protein